MPPVALVSLAGAADANSFESVEGAEAYFEVRPHADAWFDATLTEQQQALVDFTRELNVQRWKGLRATDSQALAFPRKYLEDPDPPYGAATGYLPDDEIPQWLRHATCEGTLARLRSASDGSDRNIEARVKRKKVDVIETEYDLPDRGASEGVFAIRRVAVLIYPFLDGAGEVIRT